MSQHRLVRRRPLRPSRDTAVHAAAPAPLDTWGGGGGGIRTTKCFGLYPGRKVDYARGCYGEDEPQINPISGVPGSASNITWTFVLGTDAPGATAATGVKFIDLGPTFSVDAAVNDTKSLDDAALAELQFYPDTVLKSGLLKGTSAGCLPTGDYNATEKLNSWTACMPVWAVGPAPSYQEYAAFNAMLTPSLPGHSAVPMVMHGGDTITVSISGSPYVVTVSDLTTKQTGTIILKAGAYASDTDGPLGPLFPTGGNLKTNFLPWGAVQDAPMGLSFEIGHPNLYLYPLAPYCLPGEFNCFSYNVTQGWAKVVPFRITSVTFNSGKAKPSSWGVIDTQGGSEVDVEWCGKYNAVAACTFPWYAYNARLKAITFGADYPGTTDAYNAYKQYATTPKCTSTFGPIYCNSVLSSISPIP